MQQFDCIYINFTPDREEVEVMEPSPKAGQVPVQVAGPALNPIDLIKLQLP